MLSVFILNIEIASPECAISQDISFMQMFAIKMAIPAILVLIVVVEGLIVLAAYWSDIKWKWFSYINRRYRRPSDEEEVKDFYKYWNYDIFKTSYVILVATYIPLTNFSLSYWVCFLCVNVIIMQDCKYQRDGTFTLDGAGDLMCWSPEHLSYMPAAIYGVCLYILGIPLSVAYLLFKNKERLTEDEVCAMRCLSDITSADLRKIRFPARPL